jgi:hypothetical protein
MSEEVIKIESQRNITVATYFTNVVATQADIYKSIEGSVKSPWKGIESLGVESYAVKGNNNQVTEIIEVVDGSFARRKPLTTVFEFLKKEDVEKLVKGKKYFVKFGRELSAQDKTNIITKFKNECEAYSGNSAYSNVFFEQEKEKDYNVDVCIHRSIDTLDTLSVKNNPLSEYPTQKSDTGVVVGTLMATQKVRDENGDKIKIPLSNVPIVIFNSSENFPNFASIDADGNRVRLNLIQNSNASDYSDVESYVLDVGKNNAEKELGELDSRFDGIQPLLGSVETITIPEEYKYSTITNEKGEFIIHDVPIGNQVLMFEVDLLKQGMTKDEVALNFFPYPTEEEPNVDSVPHYFFRQIPIGVTSCWGDFQTGYTQVDINANIDMRKWSTFYVPPISFGGKDMAELVSSGRFDALTILARDMTREGYPLTSEIVEISDILNRIPSQRIEWYNEFKFKKPKIEFRQNDYQAFKLPSNMYDPNGTASADSGRVGVKSKKGVWLCSYQLKMYYGASNNVYRTSGFVRDKLSNGAKSSSHFDLNRTSGFTSEAVTGESEEFGLNKFPYEKVWTINYPEPYSIPSQPSVVNESKDFNSQVEPRFLDGDLSGLFKDSQARGYGSMQSLEDYELIHNKFAQSVTKYRVYKYENEVSWHEEYSNGFRKYFHQDLFPDKEFSVKNGEKYQRLEAGFGYWVKPEGWGRITQKSWGDYMLTSDINSSFSPPSNLIPSNLIQVMQRFGENLTIKMDTTISPNWLEQGALDFYRVIDDDPSNLQEPRPPLTKKAVLINIPLVLRNNKKTTAQQIKLKYGGEKDEVTNASSAQVDIRNNGSVNSDVEVGGIKKRLKPGEKVTFDIYGGASIKLPSNTDLDLENNYYKKSNYTLDFKTSEIEGAGEIWYGYNQVNLVAGSFISPRTFYAVSRIKKADGNVKIKDGERKCKGTYGYTGDYEVNGIVFEGTKSEGVTIYFRLQEVPPNCTDGGFGVFRAI